QGAWFRVQGCGAGVRAKREVALRARVGQDTWAGVSSTADRWSVEPSALDPEPRTLSTRLLRVRLPSVAAAGDGRPLFAPPARWTHEARLGRSVVAATGRTDDDGSGSDG